jgi:hypothetical protein
MTRDGHNSNSSARSSSLIRTANEFQLAKPPRLATANDIRELVQYLKRRPAGVNIHDVPQPIKKRIFYPAKVASYEFWGLVIVNRDRVSLTAAGWEFARSLEPEAKVYRALLNSNSFYLGALEWVHRERIEVLTQDELAAFWQREFAWVFLDSEERELGSAVVTFFHLCQAAELGAMTIGKRGQPARLRIWRENLAQIIDLPQTVATQITD